MQFLCLGLLFSCILSKNYFLKNISCVCLLLITNIAPVRHCLGQSRVISSISDNWTRLTRPGPAQVWPLQSLALMSGPPPACCPWARWAVPSHARLGSLFLQRKLIISALCLSRTSSGSCSVMRLCLSLQPPSLLGVLVTLPA